MMRGLVAVLIFAILAATVAAILATIIRAATWLDTNRPSRYRGRRRRGPGPNHPASLGMERAVERQVAADLPRVMAEIDQLLDN